VSGPEDKSRIQIEDLLAADREHLRKMAEERIASGMFARVAEAHRRQGRRKDVLGLAFRGALAAAVMAAALWIGWPDKSPSPEIAKDVPQKVVGPSTPSAQTSAKSVRPAAQTHPRPGTPLIAAPSVTPRQPMFPGNTEPTEQERLMMALARSDLTREDKQLPEIAKAISVQVAQEKGQRQAFEKWLQEGGAGR